MEGGEDVMAHLEAVLGRRWTADDASRVTDWIEEQVETILGPTSLVDPDDPEYQDIVQRAIYHDLESLMPRNTDIDIEELASDIFDEGFGMFFNPAEEGDYRAFDFGDTEIVGTGLSEEVILKSLNKVTIRVGEEDRICVVCQDGLYQEQAAEAIHGCGHVYHLDCIKRWLRLRDFCPLCKAKVGQRHHQDEEDVRSSSSVVVDKFM